MGGSSPPFPPFDDDPACFIGQLDGNLSLNSSFSSSIPEYDDTCLPQHISTQVGFRPTKVIYERPLSVRTTIKRNNKTYQALTLPRLTNYNIRALFPKIGNFALDMIERESDLSFITEVWQKKENKKHQFKLEELLELRGIKYISTPALVPKEGAGQPLLSDLKSLTFQN